MGHVRGIPPAAGIDLDSWGKAKETATAAVGLDADQRRILFREVSPRLAELTEPPCSPGSAGPADDRKEILSGSQPGSAVGNCGSPARKDAV